MAMRMEELIREAQAAGLNVQYTKTTENGWTRIRVTMVGNVAYKRSEGNTALRAKMGKQLSSAERQSRKEANVGAGGASPAASGAQRARHKGKGLPKLSKSERSAIAKNNRSVKKTGKGSKMSYSQARKLKAEKGFRGVMDQAQRHYLESLGLAYPYFIEQFIMFMEGEENYGTDVSLDDLISWAEKFVRRRKSGSLASNPRKGLRHDNVFRAWRALYGYHDLTTEEQKKAHDGAFKILKEGEVSLK